ncbi:MAG: hypothetical protein PHW52_01445 [Candidatus Pacebacteria bacterium]|nr:hypothetical protein [Candidatus Paceibacterota bacterium]
MDPSGQSKDIPISSHEERGPICISEPKASPISSPSMPISAPSGPISVPISVPVSEPTSEPVTSPTGGNTITPVYESPTVAPTTGNTVYPVYESPAVSVPIIQPVTTTAVGMPVTSQAFPNNTANHVPVITVGSDVLVAPGQKAYLSATVNDPDNGDKVSTIWSVPSGTIMNGETLVATYIAPKNVDKIISLTATCTARDSKGGISTAEVRITINPWYRGNNSFSLPIAPATGSMAVNASGGNKNPIISISGTQAVIAGELIRANCSAHDADGDQLSYNWYSTEGTISNPAASSVTVTTQNAIDSIRTMIVFVTVTDKKGGISSDSMRVMIMPANMSVEPIVNMQQPVSIRAGGTLNISPDVLSPKGLPLHYAWYCSQGVINNPNSKDIIFTAPNNPGTTVVCNLMAIDSQGGIGSGSMKISVI